MGEVVYLDNKYADTDDGRISRRILDSCGISYRQVIVDVHIGTGEQTRAVAATCASAGRRQKQLKSPVPN